VVEEENVFVILGRRARLNEDVTIAGSAESGRHVPENPTANGPRFDERGRIRIRKTIGEREMQVEVTWIGSSLGNVSFQRCPSVSTADGRRKRD
jgi:hypothetical protein